MRLGALPPSCCSAVSVTRVQADQPRDEDHEVQLTAHALDDGEPARRLARRDHVAVPQRRDRDEAEVDRAGRVELACDSTPEGPRPRALEQPVADAEEKTA